MGVVLVCGNYADAQLVTLMFFCWFCSVVSGGDVCCVAAVLVRL